MARGRVVVGGPLMMWVDPLDSWLGQTGLSPGRVSRTVNAFAGLSSWMADRGLGVADLDEDVIDEHIHAERQRSGARSPAARQGLPVAQKILCLPGCFGVASPSRPRLGWDTPVAGRTAERGGQ